MAMVKILPIFFILGSWLQVESGAVLFGATNVYRSAVMKNATAGDHFYGWISESLA